MRKSYGFRTFRVLELALYHSPGKLPEPESTHDFFRRAFLAIVPRFMRLQAATGSNYSRLHPPRFRAAGP